MARIPAFTGHASLYRTLQVWASVQRVVGIRQNVVVLTQVPGEPCVTTLGDCTGPSGGTSVASNQSYRQVCQGPYRQAWVEVCRSNGGTGPVTRVDRGCGDCTPPPPPPPPPTCASGALCFTPEAGTICQCPSGEICRPRCSTTRVCLFPPLCWSETTCSVNSSCQPV
jgi:hypothetical protein